MLASSRRPQAPKLVPTTRVPDGPVLGNGRFGAVATWGQGSVEFHFGANDFFAAPMNGVRSARRFGASRVLRSTFGNSILAVTLRAVGTQNGIITEYSEV